MRLVCKQIDRIPGKDRIVRATFLGMDNPWRDIVVSYECDIGNIFLEDETHLFAQQEVDTIIAVELAKPQPRTMGNDMNRLMGFESVDQYSLALESAPDVGYIRRIKIARRAGESPI